jgi:hypothetical protein
MPRSKDLVERGREAGVRALALTADVLVQGTACATPPMGLAIPSTLTRRRLA